MMGMWNAFPIALVFGHGDVEEFGVQLLKCLWLDFVVQTAHFYKTASRYSKLLLFLIERNERKQGYNWLNYI